MRILVAFSIAFILSSCSSTRPETQSDENGSLNGTWELVRFVVWDVDGNASRPFGDPPSGYAVFDYTGHAFIQLMRMPPVPQFSGNGSGTAEEVRSAFESYAGYYGTVSVNKLQDTLSIHVEGGSAPSYNGTDQVRPFRISGDTLRLGITGRYQATLLRVR